MQGWQGTLDNLPWTPVSGAAVSCFSWLSKSVSPAIITNVTPTSKSITSTISTNRIVRATYSKTGRRRRIPSVPMGKKYLPEYKAARTLWEDDQLEEYKSAMEELLDEHDVPVNIYMRVLILLSISTDDQDKAEDAHLAYETLWQCTRKRYRYDPDRWAQTTLRCIRESLDELREVPEEEALERQAEEARRGWRRCDHLLKILYGDSDRDNENKAGVSKALWGIVEFHLRFEG
ncbi:hypothetical protein D6C98_02566 [Aureobasidium pullulans]|nr:hypothetical protein D6D26_10487 [Aureobasidium pullulans]THY59939.1 hypothetical protein D6C98_02566 [Aureobasidium pullulans]